jgi:TRAP-type C4-dicarboxylate transport system permease small subunit
MMFLTAMDVLLRYFFNRPISGAMELTEYMMVILVSLGLAYCGFVKGHVSVEVLTSRFSPKVQSILNCITYFLSFVFFLLVTWQSIKYIRLTFKSNLVSAVLHIPTFPFIAVLALGSLVFSLVLLADFLDYLSKGLNQ